GFIRNSNEKELSKKAAELAEILGISNRLDSKPATLSGGEQQRVAVARALINSPVIIFADEPSGNLDTQNARALHELFFTLRKELGQAFVIVTHNEELAAMADRTVTMKDGSILTA
ncbi:MAG: lipoprotein-releasing system ATP-binding protein, partial [Algoriphagus sp.]